jgi:hypothetical protein
MLTESPREVVSSQLTREGRVTTKREPDREASPKVFTIPVNTIINKKGYFGKSRKKKNQKCVTIG